MFKLSPIFTKSTVIQLSVLYAIVISFFYYISSNHSLEDLYTSISIATNIFLAPSIIGMFLLKWLAEVIINLSNYISK